MHTVGQVIYNVRTTLKEFSDDAKPGDRFIYSRLKNWRNNLIRKENDKGKLFNSSAMQSIHCIDLIPVDASECCNVDSGNIIYRTKNKIPKILDTSFGKQALKVYSLDRSVKFDFKSIDTIISQLKKKYKFPGASFFLENDFLYSDSAEGVKLTAIFEDPELIEDYNKCKKIDCSNCGEDLIDYCPTPMLEREFYVPGYLEKDIETQTAWDIAKLYGYVVEDRLNNAKDDTPRTQAQGK